MGPRLIYLNLAINLNFPKLIFNLNFIKKNNFQDILIFILKNITNKNELNRNKLCL